MENTETKKEQLQSVSPDQYAGRIRILSPGVWILVVALVVLLAGGTVYACLGNVNLEIPVCGYAQNGKLELFVKDDDYASVKLGQRVILPGAERMYTISGYASDPIMIPDRISEEYMNYGSYHTGAAVYVFSAKANLPSGPCFAKIVTGTVHPIRLLFD